MNNKKIALLIDAENINYKNCKQIIDSLSSKGDLIIKEIVADWTKIKGAKVVVNNKNRTEQIEGWRKQASIYSMTVIQQFTYVCGKNTCDMAMAIRAMKTLYEKPYVDIFCLVSNDSDFTRLAQEIRENNKEVIGMGERKAITEFVKAFSEFIYLGEELQENILDITEDQSEANDEGINRFNDIDTDNNDNDDSDDSESGNDNVYSQEDDKTIEKEITTWTEDCPIEKDRLNALIRTIDNILEEQDDSAYYSRIYDSMKKEYPDFVPANYGCKSVSKLIDKLMPFMPQYKQQKDKIPNNPNGAVMMLKRK